MTRTQKQTQAFLCPEESDVLYQPIQMKLEP